ncbi:MAG: rhodanese-like domain-containing protein [Calditrichaeota bacterium]|nr:rhodanese-like domain-containing protein [Candidatus Cloacimonadota bacterium]MCA9787661.1 rhodanese-like domain-containing protein [Candidatus Cloacimonadota bacterium]MCB1045701.1 rhodanese-like domain-containing protein [Calditrichota bacterium]MCB9473602.1 rhodanese-like domain-containing protein [Candidatus Delongbacteria bacterium]
MVIRKFSEKDSRTDSPASRLPQTKMNPYGAPEITATEAADLIAEGALLLMDVREDDEMDGARLMAPTTVHVALSRLSTDQESALGPEFRNKETRIAVISDHGVRSAQVTMWLRRKGWRHTVNVRGGYQAWQREVKGRVDSH